MPIAYLESNSETKKFLEIYRELMATLPQKSDAIVWLQGDRYDRGEKALELLRAGCAPLIVVTGNDRLIGPGIRPGENNVSIPEMVEWLKERDIGDEQILIDDGSFNTKDQARFIIDLAKRKNWRNFLLVGSSYYQPRAFLTFLREAQTQGYNGAIVNQPHIVGDTEIPGGRDGSASEIMKQEFEKIFRYHDDVATLDEGIDYLRPKNYGH